MMVVNRLVLPAGLGLLLVGLILWPNPSRGQAAGQPLTASGQTGAARPTPRVSPTRGPAAFPDGYGYYPTPEMTPMPQPTAGPPPAGAVTIVDFSFQPSTTTINAGETVQWTVTGSGHTSTSDTGLWDSGTLTFGRSFSYTFPNVGTFGYYCRIHPTLMRGTVNVVSAVATPTTGATATLPAVGGHGFALQTGSPGMYWTAGLQQTGYLIVRWSPTAGFAFLPSPTDPLGAGATSYTDPGPLPGPVCYLGLPLGGTPASFNQVLGLTDFLCLYPNTGQGNAPQSFSLRLDESFTAKLSWSGPGGQDSYQVIATYFNSTPDQTLPLPGSQTSFLDNTHGVTTCYQVVARASGQELGRTNRLCGVPGIGILPSGGMGRDTGAALQRITTAGAGRVGAPR